MICELKNIKKIYNKGEEVIPLRDINLEARSGEFIAIEGPSGTGKSTLLYVIGTLLKSDEGDLIINGRNTGELRETELTDMRAREIGFIFQDSSMIQALTLKENLEFAERIVKGRKDCESRVGEYLGKLGLDDRADYLPYQLSGGQRRRAMVARALINSPKLILADEPTNDLDEKWARKVIELLKEECDRGSAVIMVTHNDRFLEGATKKYKLSDGTLKTI